MDLACNILFVVDSRTFDITRIIWIMRLDTVWVDQNSHFFELSKNKLKVWFQRKNLKLSNIS